VTVHGRGTGYGIAAFAPGPGCVLRQIWRSTIGRGNQPPPLVVGRVVFDSRGSAGGFGALSAINGHQLWAYATSAATISPLIEVGGRVYGGDVAGNLYSFRSRVAKGIKGSDPVKGLTLSRGYDRQRV
jgi:PQQ-like domain